MKNGILATEWLQYKQRQQFARDARVKTGVFMTQ
jgi:hypothetical protein